MPVTTGLNKFGSFKWIVNPTAGLGTHTTIASALTSASSGDTIGICDGTYTEDLTLKAGVNLTGLSQNMSSYVYTTSNVIITGKLSFSAAGQASVSNLFLQANGAANVIAVTGSSSSLVVENCYIFSSASATGISMTTGYCALKYCSGGFQNIPWALTNAAVLQIDSCYFDEVVGVPQIATMAGSSSTQMRNSTLFCGVSTSSTSSFFAYFCSLGPSEGEAGQNQIPAAIGGTGVNEISHCTLNGGTAQCATVASSCTLTLTHSRLNSSNAHAVSGSGTCKYSDLVFTSTAVDVGTTTATLLPGGIAQGNTGTNTFTAYGPVVAGATSTSALSSISPGTASQVLQSGGASANPAWSTATFPATATGTGKILRADGTNWVATTATYPDTAGTSGNLLTSNGTNWISSAPAAASITINGDTGSAAGSTITFNALSQAGSSVSFSGASSTVSLNVTDASNNTIIGILAGNGSLTGTKSAALGQYALNALTSGDSNVAMGYAPLFAVTTGAANAGIGHQAMNGLKTGNYNLAFGYRAGTAYTGAESSNILFNHAGVLSESFVLRIGAGTGSTDQKLAAAYICGVAGVTVTSTAAVLVNTSTNQFGTVVSSERYKENISDMGDSSSFIYNLRPVKFTYKKNPEVGECTGLIAEEVQKVAPRLVCLDEEGLPCAVQYHELPALILNEIIKLKKQIEELKKGIVI